MIPPTSDIRLRSIRRWMKDQTPEQFARLVESGEIDIMIAEKDGLMIQVFEDEEDELMAKLNRSNRWGTWEGLAEFRTARMMAWQAVCARLLPVIKSEDPEDDEDY